MQINTENQIPAVQSAVLNALMDAAHECGQLRITCPQCGSADVHLIGQGDHQGNQVYIRAGDGTHVIRPMPSLGKGSAVFTIYRCETDHGWVVVQRFDRGSTYRSIQCVDLPYNIPELWRA